MPTKKKRTKAKRSRAAKKRGTAPEGGNKQPKPKKETYVAECKFTSTLNNKKTALPVTCKLQNPPVGVTVALAQLLDNSGAATNLTISTDGKSFVIPDSIAAGSWTLGAKIVGGTKPLPTILIVEDCPTAQRLLAIIDPDELATVKIAVVP